MTLVIEGDHVMYLSALNMRSDRFFLVVITFWQMIHCSLQTKTSKKAVLWQRNRTKRIEIYSAVLPTVARRSCYNYYLRSQMTARIYQQLLTLLLSYYNQFVK